MRIFGAKNSECGCDNQNNNMATVRNVSDFKLPNNVGVFRYLYFRIFCYDTV